MEIRKDIRDLFKSNSKAKFTHGGRILTIDNVDYLVESVHASGVEVAVTGVDSKTNAVEGYGTNCIKWDNIER